MTKPADAPPKSATDEIGYSDINVVYIKNSYFNVDIGYFSVPVGYFEATLTLFPLFLPIRSKALKSASATAIDHFNASPQ